MNQILHKTFLDTLLASTQQSLFSKSFAFDWTRSAGANLDTIGDFGGGNKFTGTNQDDTVIIGGNLTGGDVRETSINLLDGNDTLTVKGNVALSEGERLSILGGSGTNTININGDISDTSSESYYSNMYIELGDRDTYSTINVLDIAGSINKHGSTSIEMYGAENLIDIGKNVNCLQSGGGIELWAGSQNNVINIHGDMNVEKESYVDIRGYNINYDEPLSSTTSINVDGTLNMLEGGHILIGTSSAYAELNFKDIIFQSESGASFVFENPIDESLVDFTVDGNLLLSDRSYLNFLLDADCNLVVSGSVEIHRASFDIDSYGVSKTQSFLNGISSDGGSFESGRAYTIDILGNVISKNSDISDIRGGGNNHFSLTGDNSAFTLVGNLSAANKSINEIYGDNGNDTISITGNVSVSDGGKNTISTSSGDDIIHLNGRIGAGALSIDAGDGNDTLVLTAVTQRLFETDYKEWLTDLSASGSLAKSDLETIRVDVNSIQQSKLGWLTDIVNKANADGAHITLEDKAGHQLVNPSAYLAQNNDAHNPINDVLDHYAPAAANAAQPKAFAENVAAPSADAFAAPHFDNNSFLHEMEQQAQVHAAAAA
ncbi:MAG: hypothetical protein M3Z70_00435 [Bartonella sp.]|nr:hypothetical protein [Bartonella sp.]